VDGPGERDGLHELVVRPGEPEDADVLAAVHLDARAAAPMPAGVHPAHEVRAWLRTRLAEDEVWVVEDPSEAVPVLGYARLTPTWLDDLYVRPEAQGRGVGSLLLDLAKARRPAGFGLWVFESNAPARAFYARRGLVEVERTDGSDNEEREPDVRVVWRPAAAGAGVGAS